MGRLKKHLMVPLLLAVFFIQSWSGIVTHSASFDETHYYGVGKYLLKNSSWDVPGAILHPPLSFYLNSIPLFFVKEDPAFWDYRVSRKDLDFLGSLDFVRGLELLSERNNPHDRVLIASRLLTAFLSLLLGLYVYRFGSALFGERSGLFALLLFSFCPNMLAFSGLIGPDMFLTIFMFISVYYVWMFLEKESAKCSVLAGLYLGLALLSKYTAVLLIPCILIFFVMYRVVRKAGRFEHLGITLAVALLVLAAGYQFNLLPYVQGIRFQWITAASGHPVFLMGDSSSHGWWYFYPIAFLLKTPLALTLLFVSSTVLLVVQRDSSQINRMFLLVPIAVVIVFFCIFNGLCALRYVLPIYPFIFVLAGSVLLSAGRYVAAVYLLGVWYVGTSLLVSPHYLTYFNEAVGGPDNGYKYLLDSNLDWGQDLKGLKKYMDEHGVKRISLSYFGTDSPRRYGIDYDWLPSHHLENPHPESPVAVPPGQLVAISATNLQGLFLDNKDEFAMFRNREPIARIGHSIFIYENRP